MESLKIDGEEENSISVSGNLSVKRFREICRAFDRAFDRALQALSFDELYSELVDLIRNVPIERFWDFVDRARASKKPEEGSEPNRGVFLNLVGDVYEALPNETPEEESETKKGRSRKYSSCFMGLPEEKEKDEEELVRCYDGCCLSAVPKDCLKKIMLWTGSSAFVSTSFPIANRDGEQPNWPPVQVVRMVFMFLEVAFCGSLLGFLMKRNFPKLSFYAGYVSLISLLFAFGMIAFFTVMWVFERI